MTTVKRITDLSDYTNVLPYASELFGVYQPIVGWNSRRMKKRFQTGHYHDKSMVAKELLGKYNGSVDLTLNERGEVVIKARVGDMATQRPMVRDSIVFQTIAESLPSFEKLTANHWGRLLDRNILREIMNTTVPEFYTAIFEQGRRERAGHEKPAVDMKSLQGKLNYESSVAAMLLDLVKAENHAALTQIFYGQRDNSLSPEELAQSLGAEDSLSSFLNIENIDPTQMDDLRRVLVSPISIIHLFRQYFFELDTFLGTPEGHVWLSPGSSVEIVEEYSERKLTERLTETAFDFTSKTESTSKVEDEISDAVSNDNSSNVNYGASVTADYSKITATASFDYAASQSEARENVHRTMHEQSEKLSTEIRKKFKASFRTTTEKTEFSRSKHVLANTTPELINYELRRKMRQVGVQVQDVGSFLCWQSYVDDPGRDLGLGKLLHIAETPETAGMQPPDAIPIPKPIRDERKITIPLVPIGGGADNKGEIYVNGVESDGNTEDWGGGHLEMVQHVFAQRFVCEASGYYLSAVEFDAMGSPVSVSLVAPDSGPAIQNDGGGEARFVLNVDSVDFGGRNSVQVGVILHWQPTAANLQDIQQKNGEKQSEFRDDERRAYETSFIEAARDRINAAGDMTSRESADLREEERIVVYRRLIQDMLLNNVTLPDDRTHHVVAELINAIFDVDKMLYFVAPEWWRPRLHHSKQQLFPRAKQGKPVQQTHFASTQALIKGQFFDVSQPVVADGGFGSAPVPEISEDILVGETTGWGGIGDGRRDSYYITEESRPARFGSSLGWLLQLDGDNRRNAFLNAPWVKAVIPIRPGKEKAAINWLKAVEGAEGIADAIYHTENPNETSVDGEPLDGKTMDFVLNDMAERIRQKHKKALKPDEYPQPAEVSQDILDEGNTVTSTPVDRVYEHGFYPLEGSFRANVNGDYEIFDQWIEILPTDQTVPVKV